MGPDDGDVTIGTGVAGPGAKAGHRLIIGFESWSGSVTFVDDVPSAVGLTVDVDSLSVVRGEGGVTPLSGPEKLVVRSNALKSLQAKKFPQIGFVGDAIDVIDGGYRVTGALTICGESVEHSVDVGVVDDGDGWRLSASTSVRHSDVGLKPFSLMMGTLKVADEVRVEFAARLSGGLGDAP